MRKQLKILYAVQGTGNGHVARAREIIPILQEYGEVDVALSGDQSNVELPGEIRYRSKGLTFIYDRSGGISYWKTLFKNNLYNIYREIRRFPVDDYDVVINDFEFITAWACKLRGKRCFGMGHQASFLSAATPRPKKREWMGEMILKYYAPCSDPIGFHFDHFDKFIFKPVIRSEIRNQKVEDKGHYTVYLPAFDDKRLLRYLSQIPRARWEVFSKFCDKPYKEGNVEFYPIDNFTFIESFRSCSGILTSAGFESPAEAIYMGKKVFVIPIKRQYEQFCNAEALKTLGIPMAMNLDEAALRQLRDWVEESSAINIEYPDETRSIIQSEIFDKISINTPAPADFGI